MGKNLNLTAIPGPIPAKTYGRFLREIPGDPVSSTIVQELNVS
jgi:hypothetical protein